jgi:hypothetical protein
MRPVAATYLVVAFLYAALPACTGSSDKPAPEFTPALFALQHLESTKAADHFFYEVNGYFTDSTRRKAFTALDNVQKSRFLLPVLEIDSAYLDQNMASHFISMQEKVHGYTPILIELSGDDYGGIFYILLDQNNNPVSALEVFGGFCAGPGGETDSTLLLCLQKHSIFKSDSIHTWELRTWASTDSIPKPDLVDSITWHSKIEPDGRIITKQIDSVRCYRQVRAIR